MKIFLSTLSAILVAAIIIWFVVSAHNARVAVASAIQRDELRKITLQRELQHANAEWNEQMRRDPQFDPKGKKIRSRLREIKEASENGKPIPPNPWQSSGQQKQTANETGAPATEPESSTSVRHGQARHRGFTWHNEDCDSEGYETPCCQSRFRHRWRPLWK